MSYRIDVLCNSGRIIISFQGRLDRLALTDLKMRSESKLLNGTEAEILIRAGSEIDPAVLDDLAAIHDVSLSAESLYLVRWLKEKRKQAQDCGKEE